MPLRGENAVRSFRSIQLAVVIALLLCYDYVPAHAKFILEFTDGRKLTVSNYKEIGQSIRVYTPNGSFAFRKEDIARIVNAERAQPTPQPTPPERSTIAAPLASVRQEEASPPVPAAVTPRAAEGEALPPFPGWDEAVDLAAEGLYRARFVIGLLVGLKALKMVFAASFR
jgi:hypothetical protein